MAFDKQMIIFDAAQMNIIETIQAFCCDNMSYRNSYFTVLILFSQTNGYAFIKHLHQPA